MFVAAMEPTRTEIEALQTLVSLAKAEDFGAGDVTSSLLPRQVQGAGRFVAREPMVLAGGALLGTIAEAYSGAIDTECLVADGRAMDADEVAACWAGPAVALLAAERVALNFLQHLSAVATLTRAFVDAVAGTGAAIYDTRKTTPGWRVLEKYAVRCGGGANHRMGLHDAVLVKDNHLAVLAADGVADPLGSLADSLAAARATLGSDGFVEVEVDTLAQFEVALGLPVDVILLDNFKTADLAEAVARRNAAALAGQVALEASGGVTLQTVRAIADTGVERIAVGALTHSAGSVDIGFDAEEPTSP